MRPAAEHLRALLAENGWSVADPAILTELDEPSGANAPLVLAAEGQFALLFAAEVAVRGLEYEAANLGARIGGFLSRVAAGNPKIWEAYLVLIVYGGLREDPTAASSVERDLSYCRKLVADGDEIERADDAVALLREAISPVLPLDLEEYRSEADPTAQLEGLLMAEGQPRELVSLLFDVWERKVESAEDVIASANGRFAP